jgi:hypothetical protein
VHPGHREVHNKLKNMTDLIQVYAETNTKVLQKKIAHPPLLLKISKVMERMSEIQDEL